MNFNDKNVAVLEGAERTLPKNVRGNAYAQDARNKRWRNPKVPNLLHSVRVLNVSGLKYIVVCCRVVDEDEKYAFLMESTSIEYTTERNCLVTKVPTFTFNRWIWLFHCSILSFSTLYIPVYPDLIQRVSMSLKNLMYLLFQRCWYDNAKQSCNYISQLFFFWSGGWSARQQRIRHCDEEE